MARPFGVAVYCSSSNLVSAAFFEAAEAVGASLAARGWRLVYGAGSVGLMGAVARAVHAGSGQVMGVIPHALDRMEVTYEACDELHRVATMRERKALMEANADGFLTLPGGLGTVEEIVEILVLKQLGYLDRPVVFLNVGGFWNPLIAMFEEMIAQGFVLPTHRNLYKVVETVEDALDYIATYYPVEEPPIPLDDDNEIRSALE